MNLYKCIFDFLDLFAIIRWVVEGESKGEGEGEGAGWVLCIVVQAMACRPPLSAPIPSVCVTYECYERACNGMGREIIVMARPDT